MTAPIALALDAPDLATACQWANAVDGVFSHVKVGLETYLAMAPSALRRSGRPPHCALFLDLKIHDIPNRWPVLHRSVAASSPTS